MHSVVSIILQFHLPTLAPVGPPTVTKMQTASPQLGATCVFAERAFRAMEGAVKVLEDAAL